MKINVKSVIFIIVGALVLLYIAANYFLSHEISSKDLTRTAIMETFYRIHLYMMQEGEVPTTFYQLPVRAGYANETKDAWGSTLNYSISNDGVLSIISYGADNKSGGTEQNTDIVVRYRTLDAAGKSIIQDEYWIVYAQISTAP